jgi:putative ABC transport system permease protein
VAISVAGLAVSLSMLVAIAVMIGSFRETVTYWIGQSLKADLYVAPARRSTLGTQPTISEATEAQIATHPAVVAVDSFRSMNVPYGDGLIIVGAGRFDVLLEHGTLLFKAPRDGQAAVRATLGADTVVVSESFSLKFDKNVGGVIDLPTPGGARAFRIAGVYYDYSSDRGIVVMDRRLFARHFGDQRPTGLTVYLREGAKPEDVRAELMASLPESSRVFIRTNGALRAEILRVFDATFTITYALEAIAVFVAMLGIAGTLVTLTLERRRDLTVLRLVGADHRQIRRLVVVEAVLLGFVSLAVGLVIGTLLSLILIYVINVQSFGWTIQFHLPVSFLVQTTVLVLVATALAGLYPSRLARQFELADLTTGG